LHCQRLSLKVIKHLVGKQFFTKIEFSHKGAKAQKKNA